MVRRNTSEFWRVHAGRRRAALSRDRVAVARTPQEEHADESPGLAQPHRHPLRRGPGSEDRAPPRRHHPGDDLCHLRLGPASLQRLHAGDAERRHRRPRVHGRGDGGRSGGQGRAQGRRPHRRAVHDLLRRVRAVPARQLLGLRDDEPQQGHGREGLRPNDRGPLRLHPPHRRLCRRPGRIRARAVCRQDPHQGDEQRPYRRAGPVPRRHLPDRLAGRGPVRHRSRGHGRDLGRRTRRADGDPLGRAARSQAGDRDRPHPRAPRHGARRRRRSPSTSTRRASSSAWRSSPVARARRSASIASAWRPTSRATSIPCTIASSRR